MITNFPYNWLSLGACLHAGFIIVGIVGAVLFVAWALRQNTEGLKKWVIWTLVLGTLGGLLTSNFSLMGPWVRHTQTMNQMMNDGKMMEKMMGNMMQHQQ